MADLFAPPTESELAAVRGRGKPVASGDLMAPPTPEELRSARLGIEHSPAAGAIERGAKATAGFIAKALSKVGTAVDYVAAAPARAGLGAVIEGQNPIPAVAGQYLKHPSEAPTGKDIAIRLGVSPAETVQAPLLFNPFDPDQERVSPAGIVGAGIDAAVDPLNVLPTTWVGKAGKGAAKAADVGIAMAAKGGDLATGSKALSRSYKMSKDVAQGVVDLVRQKFPRNAPLAKDHQEFLAIATKNGIDPRELPPAVLFGPDSAITHRWRIHTEGELGEAERLKFHAAQEKVRGAVDAKIQRIAGGEAPLSKTEAGELLAQGYNRSVKAQMAQDGTTYSKVAAELPTQAVKPESQTKIAAVLKKWSAKLQGMRSFRRDPQTGQVISGLSPEGENLFVQLEGVGARTGDLQNLNEALKSVGFEAYRTNAVGMPPRDVAALRGLYHDLREAFVETVRDVDPKKADALQSYNKKMSKTLADREILEKHVTNKDKDPDQIFKAIMEGNTNRIEALKGFLTPDEFNKVRATLVDSLRRETASGEWTFGRFHQQIQAKRKFLEAVLSSDELRELEELTKLGNRFGKPVMSTSGTGATLQAMETLGEATNSARKVLANKIIVENAIQNGLGKVKLPPPPTPGGTPSFPAPGIAERFTDITGGYNPFRNPRRRGMRMLSEQETNEERRGGIRLPTK